MGSRAGSSKNIRLRLIVSLPILLSLFMLVSALLALQLIPSLSIPRDTTISNVRTVIFWIFGMILFAFLGTLLAAGFISGYLKSLIRKAENLVPQESHRCPETKADNEMDALRIVLDEATVTLGKFIQDSHILDNLPEAVISIDQEGELTSLNKKAARLFHLDVGEAKGKNLRELIPEDGGNRFLYHLIAKGLEGEETSYHQIRIPFKERKDQTFLVRAFPITGEEGPLRGVTITFKDHGDIVAIRKQIQKFERLAAIGSAAAGIAHEVRNPLGSIKTLTELMGEDFPPGDPKAIYIKEILTQIGRLDRIFEDVLAFSREPIFSVEEVNISHLISQTVCIARYNFSEKQVVAHENYEDELPRVLGDPERLTRAFLNIISNAFEAAPEEGFVKINVCYQPDSVLKTKEVKITVTDNGPGIPHEHLDKIFEPFFTTKRCGTGLGLCLSHHIITAHGGRIEVDNAVRKGTAFRITLPV